MGVLIANVLATGVMVGVIWTVQLVHYPLFAAVGEGEFMAYHSEHVKLITLIVGPAMLVELMTALALVAQPPRGVGAAPMAAGLALVGVAWGVTAAFSVPMHNALAAGFDAKAHASLVSTNWLRTLAWTARGGLMAWALWRVLAEG
jgi:hypothetical protein